MLPAGDQKIGPIDYMVTTNSTPLNIDTFNDLPIKQVGNATVYLRDVAYVHEGGPPQQNVVVVKGQQAVLIEILKTGDASTLAVVDGVRAKLPALIKTLPKGVTITPLNREKLKRVCCTARCNGGSRATRSNTTDCLINR